MSTAPANFSEFHEDNLSKSLAERESAIKERLQAAWQLHIARVQEELESGWQSHIGVAVEGVLVNLQDSLRTEMQETARALAESQSAALRETLENEAESKLESALLSAQLAAEEAQAEVVASLRAEFEEEKRAELQKAEETLKQHLHSLHKAVRRCEQAENREDVVAALLDGVSLYAERAALLQLESDMITGFHGTEQRETGVEPISLEIPVEQAPALHNAKQSGEPLVAMRLESEFSRELLEQMGEALDEKIRVFPVMSRNAVRALLVLEAGTRQFEANAVEVLTISAGHKWNIGKETAEPAQLIAIQGSGTQEPKAKDSKQTWFQLSPQEQEIHLRAQRYARVQVAELRLYQSERVRQARKDSNIYGVFRQEIDQVRTDFKTQFVETCPSMLDYYHMEVVRILANENEKVLGPDYPGPLV